MNNIEIYLRVKGNEDLTKIALSKIPYSESNKADYLWESSGEYYLEAFQCGRNLSICSIEKDPRILSSKEEISLMIIREVTKPKKEVVKL